MILYITLVLLVFVVTFELIQNNKKRKQNYKAEEELNKVRLYYQIMNVWFSQEQRGKTLINYLKNKGYNRIAIYGMAELGQRLFYELTQNDIEVVCVIDQSPYIWGEFDLYRPEMRIPEVDVVVVTAEYNIKEIRSKLSKTTSAEIIGISTLIGNAFRMNW